MLRDQVPAAMLQVHRWLEHVLVLVVSCSVFCACCSQEMVTELIAAAGAIQHNRTDDD